ncbi:iron-containing alcohol dehydrogenase [Brucella intermedia]|uniref:iron-containing alcohol dehydrogenase n=1 Tax=Brucella intermedia TaxID=94625 RepID=UPI00224B0A85|nr:iron-containing alcohol dehydrogenase [Brucella intermedia]
MTISGTIRSPKTVYFGSGQRHALPTIVSNLGRRVFLCSDERLKQDAKLRAVVEALTSSGVEVEIYDRTVAELPLECIHDATNAARAFKPDVILGIGGGSCLDIAKLVSLSLTHGSDLSAFYGEFKVPGPIIPVIAVPTTAGTGSEITPVAVLADPSRGTKVGISSPYLIAEVSVCDPELTITCPPSLTAVAGADALTHAIEAFTAIKRPFEPDLALRQVFIGKNTMSDAQAKVAIAALAGNLALAVKDGTNVAAREQVMYGAMTAGLAFGVAGTAAAHAIQYPIGALTKTAHGLGVAVLMPYVMEFNRDHNTDEFAEIARLFGASAKSEEELADLAIDLVVKLFAEIGIPETTADLGVTEDKLSWIAEQSLLSARLVKNNPRPLDFDALLRIARASFNGDRKQLRNN